MSTFGDYKSYKNFAPQYSEWKTTRDFAEAKRITYLKQNPHEIREKDIQKSKTLLRAIDVMDEYSQKRAEDMEIATESVVSNVMEIALMLGSVLGMGLYFAVMAAKGQLPKAIEGIKNPNQKKLATGTIVSAITGGVLGTAAAFPLYAWAAKAEVKASRKGRFEAMNKELKDPKTFATLSPEQEEELNTNLAILSLTKKSKTPITRLKDGVKAIKDMLFDSKEYQQQKLAFDEKCIAEKQHFDKELTEEEIEKAKEDQQLLTKLVEKIDIASQDYAENAELATSALTTTIFGFGALFTLLYEKVATKLKLPKTTVPAILSISLMVFASIFSASIQKQAARVGRFKAKQELMQNPEKLVYVSDEKTNEITDIEFEPYKKQGMFKFLKNAWKNNKEFENWKKTEGEKQKKLSEAMESIELSEEQIQDAKRLQKNTFKTFNKVDEKSQRYSESLEALGQAVQYPISLIASSIGLIFGMKHLNKAMELKGSQAMNELMKYLACVFVSTLPSLGLNAYITKEQKKASRVADMLAIKEIEDHRNFADYSKFMDK